MDTTPRRDAWSAGDCYEPYVGRWSRRVAAVFVERLAVPRGRRWADVGCGTGALTHAILERCDPAAVTGIDASARPVGRPPGVLSKRAAPSFSDC